MGSLPRNQQRKLLRSALNKEKYTAAKKQQQQSAGQQAAPVTIVGKATADATRRKARQAKRMLASENSLRIVFDLSYSEHMDERELRNLKNQLKIAYSDTGARATPPRLVLTSLEEGGKLDAQLKAIAGFASWQMDKHAEHFTQVVADRSALVYLSPDATDVLTGPLDPTKVYVIGGLVDRAQAIHGISLGKATEHAVRAARLPIQELVRVRRGDRLPVNQVVNVLCEAQETGGDWRAALLKYIPETTPL